MKRPFSNRIAFGAISAFIGLYRMYALSFLVGDEHDVGLTQISALFVSESPFELPHAVEEPSALELMLTDRTIFDEFTFQRTIDDGGKDVLLKIPKCNCRPVKKRSCMAFFEPDFASPLISRTESARSAQIVIECGRRRVQDHSKRGVGP